MKGELISPFRPESCYCTPVTALGHCRAVLVGAFPTAVRSLCPRPTTGTYMTVTDNANESVKRVDLPTVYPFTNV